MGNILKNSWQLASERIIASRYRQKDEKPKKVIDIIEVPEFSDREDKAVNVTGYSDGGKYAKETQLIENPEDARKKKEEPMTGIKIQEPETIKFSDSLECCFCGSFMSQSGFSKMNRNYIFGLSNRNVKIQVEDISDSFDVNEETQKQIRFLENTEISPKAPKIYSMTVPSSVTHGGRKIAYTMIESSSLHKDYCEKLNLMDELWVPSNFGKDLMQKSSIHPPIYVMPLGVDVDRYKSNCGIMDFGTSMRSFKFLCVSKYSARKNFDILLRAFMQEFCGEEDVSLLLVTNPLHTQAGKKGIQIILDDFNDIKQTIKKEENELPHIALYTKFIPERDMPKVYNSCNAFVLISSGEGFGLPYCEAASCGLPVIASNVTAHTDYLKTDNSFLVEPDGFLEAKINGNLSNMAKLCHFYNGQTFPDFSRTGVDQTKKHMRFVFENYKEAKEKAEKLRKLIINNYTWELAADRVYKRLMEIS